MPTQPTPAPALDSASLRLSTVPGLTLRFARGSDADTYAAFQRQSFPDLSSSDDAKFFGEALEAAYSDPLYCGQYYILAEFNGQLVGAADVHPEMSVTGPEGQGGALILNLISVLPEVGGRGIGTALVEACCAVAETIGALLLVAHIPETACPFYESTGWMVLPGGQGFGWVEPESVEDALWAPSWADERGVASVVRATRPEVDKGYPHVAVRMIGSGLRIGCTFADDGTESNEAAARQIALLAAKNPAALNQLPLSTAKVLLPLMQEGLSNKDAADLYAGIYLRSVQAYMG